MPQEFWLGLWFSEHCPWGNVVSCSLFSATPKWCHNCLTTNLTVRVMVHPNPMFSNIFVCSQGDEMIGVKMCSLLYLDVLYEHTSIFNSQSLENTYKKGAHGSALPVLYPFFICFFQSVGREWKGFIYFLFIKRANSKPQAPGVQSKVLKSIVLLLQICNLIFPSVGWCTLPLHI